MKKCLFTILSCLVCGLSLAQGITTIDGVKYYLGNGEAMIMEQDQTLAGNIVIPEKVSYNGADYTVTSMTDYAFQSTAITGITLPESLTSWGERCFWWSKLESIVVPKSVTSLPASCFHGCENLKSVTLHDGITSIGSDCFNGCTSLESITLPSGITNLEAGTFYNCSALKSIELPSGITSLGSDCFCGCTGLTAINIPNKVTILDYDCFYGCTGLTSVTLPESVTTLGEDCFNGCTGISTINLPNSITSMGNYCFRDCNKLESVTLPNSMTTVPFGCFYGCTGLTSVTLPNSIIKLAGGCFKDCSSLETITLHEGINSIDSYGFASCSSLKAITLPRSITDIGSYCFSNCSSLATVTCKWENQDEIVTGLEMFNYTPAEKVLNVPMGTGVMYASTTYWKDFTTINEVGDTPEEPEKCATPVISYRDSMLVFTSETEGAEYHYTITDNDIITDAYSYNGKVRLSAAYNISVYASADGYTNSDVAKAVLYFIKVGSGSGVGVSEIFAEERGVVLATDGQTVKASGLADGEAVSLYTTDGMLLSTAKASADGIATLDTKGERGVLIVKVGNDGLKIAVN